MKEPTGYFLSPFGGEGGGFYFFYSFTIANFAKKFPLNISAENILSENSHYLNVIAQTAKDLGFPCYLIGGYVRDRILNRPCKDLDIVCVGSGIQLAEEVAKKFSPSPYLAVFKNFGTAMLKFEDIEIEFVGARKESYRDDSRKPIVEDGTLLDDLNRRDFTINTLAVSLNEQDFGKLIDNFNGLEDLKNKMLHTPLAPDQTFSDDPLRMLRAIRFATQLDFTIDSTTFNSIQKNKERIKIVSFERITDELNKIIASPVPSIGFKLLFESDLLAIIFPEMITLHGVEKINGKAHKDNFFHTLQVLDNLCKTSDDLWLRWAAILHDIAKPRTKRFDEREGWTFHGHDAVGARMVPKIFNRMKLPMNEKMRFVQKMVALHLRPISLTKENVTDSAIRRLLFEAGDDIDQLLLLCNADITSKNENKVKRYLQNFEMVRQKLKEVEEADKIRNWQPPITGEIIMQTFEIPPSKKVGIIKDTIREAILDGKIKNNFEEAFQLMLTVAKEMGMERK